MMEAGGNAKERCCKASSVISFNIGYTGPFFRGRMKDDCSEEHYSPVVS